MRIAAIALVSIMVAACATTPVTPPTAQLFADGLFRAPSERISAGDVFATSDAMKRFVGTELAGQYRARGLRQGLVDALATKGRLKVEYESALTRNAAQTFDARAGNCLSLVIMTAALAKEIGLPVRYRSVFVDDTWALENGIYYSIGHVNVVLGLPLLEGGFGRNDGNAITIDFLPPPDLRGARGRDLGESTIVAMYMNNRAAESLAQGRLDEAYWWARAAIENDSGFAGAYNTLGVVYLRHGDLREAERVLAYALEREPENTHVASNLAQVLGSLGRVAEREVLLRRLERLEPDPPLRFYNLGHEALRKREFRTARDMFAKEVARAPDNADLRFWLAVAQIGLGEIEPAREQLERAIRTSATRRDHELYSAKLDQLTARHLR